MKAWLWGNVGWMSDGPLPQGVLLALGGALGTYLRYRVGVWFRSQPWADGFPYGTLTVNVVGSFLLGTAVVLLLERLPPGQGERWYLLVGTGFCGGFTTFSTFEYETFQLVRDGSLGLALLNVMVSVLGGFLAVVLAVKVMGLTGPRP